MTRSPTRRLLPLLAPLVLLSACGLCSGDGRAAAVLDNRLQAELRPDTAAGRAAVQPLPGGAQVTLPEQTLFPAGGAVLTAPGRYVLASVIEGLLDPRILRIDLTQAPETPPALQQARLRAVRAFFEDFLIGPALQPAGGQPAVPVAAGPPGTMVTVTIVQG